MNDLNGNDKESLNSEVNIDDSNQSENSTDDNGNTTASDDTTKGSKMFNELCDMIESVLFSIFTVILIFTFVFKVASVVGTSMEPTLVEDDKLIVSSTFYNNPKQKDIIIIDAEDAHLLADTDDDGEVDDVVTNDGLHKTIVKRVIAVAGQTVDIDFTTGNVYIDGEVINEPYINNLTLQDHDAFEYPITVPDGYVFVMGDNREVSKDSRSNEIGLIDVNDIIGKVVLRISPFEKFGTVD
jgi:signal peptidase I